MKLIRSNNKKKGFTLIELVIVIAILAVLALILVPQITGYITSANNAKDEANAKAIYTAAVLGASEKEGTDTEKTTAAQAKVLEVVDIASTEYTIVISGGKVTSLTYKDVVLP